MGRKDGSITLFLALVLTLVFSLCFSLLEAARVQALHELAPRKLLLNLESLFGQYNPDLWAEYGLLFLDAGNEFGELDVALLEGRAMEETELAQRGAGFYQLAMKDLQVTEYALATDAGGAAFEKQACAAIQAQLAAGAAELIKGKLDGGKKIAKESEDLQKQWESAKNAMSEAEEIEQGKERVGPDGGEGAGDSGGTGYREGAEGCKKDGISAKNLGNLPENPVNSVDILKSSLMLNLVVEDPSGISGKAIPLSDTLSNRRKAQGNLKLSDEAGVDKLWFLQYLNRYFSCGSGPAQKGSEAHALEYELEYCVAGKSSDYENLEKTVKELLLIREAGNFTTIMQDGKKQALALEIATAAVGFTGAAPLIYAVKIGILLAWSYIESILDVRCLLSGGRVALVKAVPDWKSDVSVGEEVLKKKAEKTESREDGLDYREYLQILLLLVREETLVCRAMDIVERNMALKKELFKMDCQIHGVQAVGLYTASPLFLGFVTTQITDDGLYHFRGQSSLLYK